MIRRPPRSTQSRSSAASDVYKRQRLLLAALWRKRAQLLQRVAHIVGIGAGGGDLALMARALGFRLLPSLVSVPNPSRLTAQPAIGIDQVAVAARVYERALVELHGQHDE